MGSNIPLPPGSPPPIGQQQQNHQQQQQQQQQHQNQQQVPTPVFGLSARPLTFESLAGARRENVVESTLHQYGPGTAIPISSPMSHAVIQNSNTAMSTVMSQQQQMYLRQQQQHQQQFQQQQFQQQQQQLQQRMSLQNRTIYQPSTQYQHQQQNPMMLRHANLQSNVVKPPTYISHQLPVHCQSTPPTSLPTYHINPTSAPTTSSNNSFLPVVQSNRNLSPVKVTPDVPISPPLDAIRGSNHPNNIVIATPTHQEQAKEETDETTTQEKNLITQVRENWDKWTQNQMIQEYNKLGQQLSKAQSARADLEKEVNDIVRKNPGQNVELNQAFIKKKQELSAIGLKCEDINRAMKFIGDKSMSKYNRKLENPNARQPLQNAQSTLPVRKVPRAKMSTATPSPNVPKKDSIDKKDSTDKKDALFDLKDDPLWCRFCDAIFHSLGEFCSHLHKWDHTRNTEGTSRHPWRHKENPKRQLGRFETFTRFRSICDLVNETSDTKFSLKNLDSVLHPSMKDKEKLKELELKRERKQFDDNDRLFSYKGYDELVPITGFYCKLCNRTLCDEKEVERHMKGWSHNMEYVRSISLQPAHERDFRVKMDRALKSLSETEKARSTSAKQKEIQPTASNSRDVQPTANKARDVSARAPADYESSSGPIISHWSARLPYKKPTSKIVDEHDVIADKFDKRKDRDPDEAKRPNRPDPSNTVSPDLSKSDSPDLSKSDTSKPSSSPTKSRSPKKQRDRPIPEIVPITNHQPSASLKRLKHPYSEKPKKRADPELDDFPKKTKRAPQIVIDSSTEDEIGSPTKKRGVAKASISEDSGLPELCLEKGDPNSPFPDLDIFINGNLPLSVLTDGRLRQKTLVKMNRVNLDDYKEMMLDNASLWNRVDGLMTKKEPGEFQKNLQKASLTAPCYFGKDGEVVPVSVDRDSSDESSNKEFNMNMLENFFCN